LKLATTKTKVTKLRGKPKIIGMPPLSLWHNRRHQTTPFSKKSVSSLKTTGKHFLKTIKNK